MYSRTDWLAPRTAGRGLRTLKEAGPDEILLDLRPAQLLNVKTTSTWMNTELLPTSDRPSHASHQEQANETPMTQPCLPLTSPQALSLLLAQWRAHTSELAGRIPERAQGAAAVQLDLNAFLQTMPREYATVPLTWSLLPASSPLRAHAEALLSSLPPHVRKLSRDVERRFARDWRAVQLIEQQQPQLLELLQPLVPGGDTSARKLSEEDYMWGWLSINSRCLHLPLGLRPHGDNLTLAPLLDMANHTSIPTLECSVKQATGGGLTLKAPSRKLKPQGLEAGEEVFITYGAHSEGTLLTEYGFLLAPHPHSLARTAGGAWQGSKYAEVNLDAEITALLEAQCEVGKRKVELLQERGYWLDYTLHALPQPAPSHRLIPALRLLHISDISPASSVPQKLKTYPLRSTPQLAAELRPDELALKTWEDTLIGLAEMVDEENERKARATLRELCADVQKQRKQALEALPAPPLAPPDGDADAWVSAAHIRSAHRMIESLLWEEHQVAQSVCAALDAGVEW